MYTCQAHGLITNGQSIGGLATLNFTPSYKDVARATAADAFGEEDVERSGLSAGVSCVCSDPKKAAAILAATPGDTQFHVREAGTGKYTKYDLVGATKGAIVWNGARIGFPKVGDATLTLEGRIRFASGVITWADVMGLTDAEATGGTVVYPARVRRAHNFSFDPDGAAPAITLSHLAGIELAVTADVIEEYGDDAMAVEAVERLPFKAATVTATHGDAKEVAPSHVNAALVDAGRGVLTVDALGMGGAAEQTLTINNVLWTGGAQNEESGYTKHQTNGVCGWRQGAVQYGLLTAGDLVALWTFADKA